jgi:hypothetical protein
MRSIIASNAANMAPRDGSSRQTIRGRTSSREVVILSAPCAPQIVVDSECLTFVMANPTRTMWADHAAPRKGASKMASGMVRICRMNISSKRQTLVQSLRRVPPGSIRLLDHFQFPLKCQIFPDGQHLMAESRSWLLPYVTPLGGDARIKYIIDETLSMCPYLYPDADREGLFLATTFLTLEFVNDDLLDGADVIDALCASGDLGQRTAEDLQKIRSNPRALVQGLLMGVELLRNPETNFRSVVFPDGITGQLFLHQAIHDISVRLHDFGRRSNSSYFSAWIGSMCDALARFGASHENIYAKIEEMSAEGYTEHKFVNSGMLHTVQLLELATGSFLSPEQHELPLIAELKNCCCRIGSLLNEIASYEKEVFRENAANLLLVIMLKLDVDLETATRHVARLVQRYTDDVMRLREQASVQFAGDDNRGLLQYARGLESLAAACWHWQVQGTPRYKSATSPFAEFLGE